jgi:hypothetical protein
MEAIAHQFLKHPREDPSLVTAFLPELLRIAIVSDSPPGLEKRFWQIRSSYLTTAWEDLRPIKGFTTVFNIAPKATQRELKNFGDVFRLFSYIFEAVVTVGKKHGSSAEDLTRFVKFVSLGTQYQEIMRVFLLFDKLVFQNKFFISALNEKLVKVWSTFTQIMWSFITKNKELATEVIEFFGVDN